MTKPMRACDKAKIWGLIEVAKGQRAPSSWIRNASVLNVYTNQVEKADVVIFEDRIAYVGTREPKTDGKTQVIDAAGYTLVPGYIEPHAHPFQLYNFTSFGEFALSLGTTTLVSDNLIFYLNMDQAGLGELMEYSNSLPIKNLWWARVDPQSTQPEMLAKFTTERLFDFLQNDSVAQAGELTSWPALIAGDETMLEGIAEARRLGKKIEGHHPGASSDTLNVMAALGVTACHEAISAEEVNRRLALGMYATLRHSSIRPDLPHLIQGLVEQGLNFWSARIMMTTDGSMPPFHNQGCMDYLVRLAMENGVPPQAAYKMASLNPAVYYGLDQEIGGIAPGRLADILFLRDLSDPTPEKVMADGKLVAKGKKVNVPFPAFDWQKAGLLPMDKRWRMKKEWLEQDPASSPLPVIHMVNAVITKLTDQQVAASEGGARLEGADPLCFVSLIDQEGKWIANSLLRGFASRLDALATTYTASQDILVIGQDRESMVQAVNELLERGGGIILKEGSSTLFRLDLPLGGKMSTLSMDELMKETTLLVELLKERGHKHIDPLYTMFFLSATHLPAVRLTAKGVYSVKENCSVYAEKPL